MKSISRQYFLKEKKV